MKKVENLHSTSRSVVWLVLAVLASVGLFSPTGARASEPAPHPGTARFEVDFLSDMIDHHAMAIEMAEMCLEEATHTDLRNLCTNIMASQSEEIETMQAWLGSWYGVTHAPEMKPGDMKRMERLASLSGEDFEIEFMEMMSRHHAMAVKMASRCVDRAYHEELKALCGDIIATQTAEIEQMQEWLCEWYDVCRASSPS